ncbi:TPA: GIY-YIG nuclease family protein [Burkholderia cepacia]|uniref:GIY-YIG nuclease family protein n=1 Tax=Burkholderia cepacia TaxID=292 RepID=UPI001CF508BD|nr:GIY-YIG nuclease family protein [Burkholderia cepacia]MCA8359876.1 GIY-YIG nuclease family protein [Burkholderia cepacia]HDR9758901.1 GIY-YIG nuclease family protein [Burkholderia cepacia ATCC 25416]HDV6365050.1 GIY-YIG nuclease family protein [Burkholderia cepacia]
MSWFLYLIECADDSVYTGITTDVAARFDEHASGKGARYTRSRKPRAVLASFPLPDRSIASRAEYWVKRLTAAQKRELAAGIRTLESVLPAGMSIDGNVDAAGLKAGLKAGKRERKKAKAQSADITTQAAETDKPVKKAAKARNDGNASTPAKTVKHGQAAQAPKKTKATKRAKTDDAAEVKKGSPRGKSATKATKAAPKQKTPAAGGKSVAKPRTDVASAPARSRAPATRTTTDTVETPANPVTATRRATRANGARSASNAAALPAPAPARPRKKTTPGAGPRTKQNRAAS